MPTTSLHALQVIAHAVGVGLPVATVGATLCVKEHLPRLAVLVGTCGAYAGGGFAIGDVAVSSRIHLVALSSLPALGERSQVPEAMPLVRSAHAESARGIESAGAKRADVATTLGVTVDDEAAAEIARATGAQVEHMEAFGVATVCAALEVPFVAVLGVANVVGSSARADWRANHRAASKAAVGVVVRWL